MYRDTLSETHVGINVVALWWKYVTTVLRDRRYVRLYVFFVPWEQGHRDN